MKFDLIAVANPVWETARLVEALPTPETPARDAGNPVGDGGGSALNTACALAAAGWRVLAVGRVGDDPSGDAALDALRRRGVEVRCEIAPGRTTKRNILYVERDTGATAFEVELPPRLTPPWEEDPPGLTDARVLLLDRLAVASRHWLMTRRQVPGLWNALNRNSPLETTTNRRRFREALPFLDYLQIPEDPDTPPASKGGAPQSNAVARAPGTVASAVGPIDRSKLHRPASQPPLSGEEVAAVLQAGVRILVRTRGAKGALVHVAGDDPSMIASGQPVEIPAEPTEAVDPTGAGDAFAAGLLDGILRSLSPPEAARRGVDWAARACRHLGARGWLDHEPPGSR